MKPGKNYVYKIDRDKDTEIVRFKVRSINKSIIEVEYKNGRVDNISAGSTIYLKSIEEK